MQLENPSMKHGMLSATVVLSLVLAGTLLPLLAGASHAAAPVATPRQSPESPTSGVVYTVTTVSDAAITAGCGGVGTCSLRGAVQLANSSPITPVFIFFAA